ncbi:MAG TPA: protein kinase [Kofleriaceae bacterium]|nr:protein kinase [Kofleriaceae bacterium]
MAQMARTGDRYRVLRQIGAGGMGIVYEAEDLERGQKVALKTIEYDDVEKVYRLKREFRVLADLSHPNLVSLFDLVVDADSCFFTMELLDGTDLLTYLWNRPVGDVIALASTTHSPMTAPSAPSVAAGQLPTPDGPTDGVSVEASPCDIAKLRAVLPQLARGLRALHAAGKIHRDIKPSNIRVTSDGRAVLLDFGLVAELERRRSDGIVGTVAYMAPEQCAGDVPLTAAADWYALGVVLFQALTGRLPFDGAPSRVLYEKQTRPASRPSQLVRGLPSDLDELCAELLEREPTARLGGPQLLRRLGVSDGDSGRLASGTSRSRDGGCAGRDAELAALEGALAGLKQRRGALALVRAMSGMGKTTLVEHFLERVRVSDPDAVVLRGRCIDTEDVPYKAIDHMIDELSEWWLGRTPREAEAILPRDASLLPTLFPVLERVPAIADAPRTKKVVDPQTRRTLAFEALRETLRRLGDRHTVVLFLDDMQWVDRDTTTLLADLMRAPDPPPVLLVLAARADESEPVLDLVKRMDVAPTIIDVGPLPEQAALALALSQLGDNSAETARRLVREADGSPLFLLELTRFLHGRSVDAVVGKGIDAMLAERVVGLGESARLVAEVVAVAGEPVTRRVLGLVTALPNAELTRQLSLLRAERIVRMSGSRADDTIESYHARVRTSVLHQLSPERRSKHHRTLATALSAQGSAEQLARHWYAAGDIENASAHAKRAGDEARAKLDFDLSARWYAISLEGPQWTEVERRALQTQLADALADAGRPREAAERFMLAANGADRATALELRRRAAGSLLQSGYVAEGLELTRTVLEGVGLRMTKTPLRALFSMLVRRAWLRIRGLGFRRRALSEISQAELTRVDVCEGVSFGLALVDTFRSMDFAARFLHLALRLGEPWRISRALALEADLLAATAKGTRAQRLLDKLEHLTQSVTDASAPTQLTTTRAFIDFFIHNRFRTALGVWTDAIASYRANVGRAGFELDTVSMFCCWCLYYMGEIGELSRRVPAMAEAADRNGNRFTTVTLRSAFPIAWLVRLDPDAVEAGLDNAVASWTMPDGSYQLQHMFALCSRIELALYRQDPESVTALIPGEVRRAERALLDRAPIQGLLLRTTLARHALACAAVAPANSPRRREALAIARAEQRCCRKFPLPFAPYTAQVLEGVLFEIEGNTDAAIAAYRECIEGLDRHDTHLFAHAARHRLGGLIGGEDGAKLRADVEAFFTREGLRDPAAVLAMLLPGPR